MPLTGKLCISGAHFSVVLLLNTQAPGMVGFHVAEVLSQTFWLRNKLQSWHFSCKQNVGICPVRKPAQRCLTWKTKTSISASHIVQVKSPRSFLQTGIAGADLSVQDT